MSGGAAPALETRGLSAGYLRDEPVVREISFTLARGSMTALIGPNGAGKSTLIKAMLGLVPFVTAERIAFLGTDLATARDRVAYIPQRSQIDWNFPACALDIVEMGLYPSLGLFRRVGRETREKAREALATVGLAGSARAQIGALSGGQQQRVLVAREAVEHAPLRHGEVRQRRRARARGGAPRRACARAGAARAAVAAAAAAADGGAAALRVALARGAARDAAGARVLGAVQRRVERRAAQVTAAQHGVNAVAAGAAAGAAACVAACVALVPRADSPADDVGGIGSLEAGERLEVGWRRRQGYGLRHGRRCSGGRSCALKC